MPVIVINKTDVFVFWLKKLRGRRAKVIIATHIDRMEDGNFGKAESVGEGVFEKKIDYGPGYRLYYCHLGESLVLLLCGGDKSEQQADIALAKEIRRGVK